VKVNFTFTDKSKLNTPSFAGFQCQKTDKGATEYEFNYPYDDGVENAYLEIFNVEKNDNDTYYPVTLRRNFQAQSDALPLEKAGVKVNLKRAYGLFNDEPFAYRYKLVNKNNGSVRYVTDPGTLISSREFPECNINTQSDSKIDKGGSMELYPVDANPGFVYDEDGKVVQTKESLELKEKAKKATKTFTNKMGGTLAGLEQQIPKLKEQGYTRIVSLPLFTDDSLSAHGYWNKNTMQISQSIGNINNYASFQKKMFKAGINLVADGAYVNEGLEGIHFKDILKWQEKSPYYEWFRAEGIKDGPLSFGVFSKNQEFIRHKVVNSPYEYVQDPSSKTVKIKKNHNYNPNKPTKIQIFDDRLVTPEEKADTKNIIKVYSKLNPENPSEAHKINNHNDSVINYSFPINPEIYNQNIKNLNEYNSSKKDGKISLDSPAAARFLTKSDSYQLEDKFESGFETWDANTDIGKLNFYMSNADIKSMKNLSEEERNKKFESLLKANYQVQDYAIASGKYWTKKTNDILLEDTAKNFNENDKNPIKAYNKIISLIDAGELPEFLRDKVSVETVKNVFDNKYPLTKTQRVGDYKDLLLSGLMDLPLDSIEFGDDVTAVMGYPYITNRSSNADGLGVSRYNLYKNENPHLCAKYEKGYLKTQDMYTNQLSTFADEIMSKVNDKFPDDNKIFNGHNATTFGKYVLPLVGQDIAKFAIIKALDPKAKVTVKPDGEIVYDYKALKETSLLDVGVIGTNPEDEASTLISKIKNGVVKISDEDKKIIADSVYKRIKDTNANGFKLSEMIIDRSQAGLDWRIDATKDVADIDAIRNKNSYFAEAWDNVINFWSNFKNAVRGENPNAYMAAEITDLGEIHDGSGRFTCPDDAQKKFLEETGITTTANYNTFFTAVANIFGKDYTDGSSKDKNARDYMINDKLVGENYLHSAQMGSLLYSYTFIGNHDKPRALHCMALDMGLFHTNFQDSKNYEHKKIATGILKNKLSYEVNDGDVNSIDFDYVSNKAIAMADSLKSGFGKILGGGQFGSQDRCHEVFDAIGKSISDLAQGSYLGSNFSADGFGTEPFDKAIDMVLAQAKEKHGLNLNDYEKGKLVNGTFETLIKPAMSKLKGMMSFLVALPGNPTLFAGDDLGLTGYDEKMKNVTLKGRGMLNWDVLGDKNKSFVNDYYNDMNSIMGLRARPELKPLNTGAPYALGVQMGIGDNKSPLSAILRHSTNGAAVISLFNASGSNLDYQQELQDSDVQLYNISLSGSPAGLPIGKEFHNADARDKSTYKVVMDPNTGNHVINRFDVDGKYGKIDVYHTTLILYSAPDKKPSSDNKGSDVSFSGKKVLYNPQYSFVSNPYKKVEQPKVGSKMLLLSK